MHFRFDFTWFSSAKTSFFRLSVKLLTTSSTAPFSFRIANRWPSKTLSHNWPTTRRMLSWKRSKKSNMPYISNCPSCLISPTCTTSANIQNYLLLSLPYLKSFLKLSCENFICIIYFPLIEISHGNLKLFVEYSRSNENNWLREINIPFQIFDLGFFQCFVKQQQI